MSVIDIIARSILSGVIAAISYRIGFRNGIRETVLYYYYKRRDELNDR